MRVTAEFRACGLEHASRFVLARRIRVRRDDPRFEANGEGALLLGTLSEDLLSRQQVFMGLIAQTWNARGLRYRAERAGTHPIKLADGVEAASSYRAFERPEGRCQIGGIFVCVSRRQG